MAPDSVSLEIVAVLATVLAAVGTGLGWTLVRGRLRHLHRAGLIGLCLALTASCGLIWANRQVEAYPTWASLIGADAAVAGPLPPVIPGAAAPGVGDAHAGRVLSFTVRGRTSAMTAPMYVYVPPGYADSRLSYPVIEALHGYPSTPLQWLTRLKATRILDAEIAAGRMAPTIVLFPYQTPRASLDTECTNLVNGPQAETFLTVDVPEFVRAHLRVRAGSPWGLIGYSAGGYCATDLLLRHPTQYAAGASLSGYTDPGIRIGDGSEHTGYSVLWRLHHLPVAAVGLYLACARTDGHAMRNTAELARLAHAPMSTTTAYVNGGGHNVDTWKAMEAPAWDWLSSWLGRPVPLPGNQASGSSR